MTNIEKRLEKLGIQIPRILMPTESTDMYKWAVVACDQYTSELEYWEDVETIVGDAPSTLNLIYPECFLEETDSDARIKRINSTMGSYLKNGILKEGDPSFFLVERSTSNGSLRYGMIAALDLEAYDYSMDSKSHIRATEGTIIDRIPPRKKIRINAPIELPHILVLIDDSSMSVIEPLVKMKNKLEAVYDFELMKASGHISGYKITDPEMIEGVISALEKLSDKDDFIKKYGSSDVLLFAMGDGNHSLATAKATWQEIKNTYTGSDLMTHPARWALVEIENIYDQGIIFEPIHRVLFNFNKDLFFNEITKTGSYEFEKVDSVELIMTELNKRSGNGHKIGYCDAESMGVITLNTLSATIPAGAIQKIIDSYLQTDQKARVDYIHGEDVTEKLGIQKKNCGIFLSAVDKNDFFRTVVMDSAFPRKTFSMGEASQKRFYIESRRIR